MSHEEALTKAKIALMSRDNTAFFTTILFNLKVSFSEKTFTAATNGTDLLFNKDFLLSLNPEERLFLLVHEVLHVAYMHMIRLGDRDPRLFNMAADYAINGFLIERGFTMPKDGLYDPKYKGMSTEAIYALLLKENPDNLPELPMEDLMAPAEGTDGQEGETGLQDQIEELLIRAQIQSKMADEKPGSIPGELELFIESLLTPKLPWHKILYKYLLSITKDDYSYKRPNKRYLPEYYLPSLYSEGMGKLAIAVDISGSVTDLEFKQFITEVGAMLKQLKPSEISLILFDTEIKSITSIKSMNDLMKVKFVGRGGTDIYPILQHLDKTKPQISVIFTDGDFNIPKQGTKVPLIWLIHNNPKFSIHYGKTIHYKI